MSTLSTAKFRFRKHDKIGFADAEQDESFLTDCFVDNGDLAILSNCDDPRRILLGRTGSGKTALLNKLAEIEEHVVPISPEQLSLSYLSNSTILRYLAEIGVDLDLFYKLLWQHVFAVELIKERYRITNESTKKSFLNQIFDRLRGVKRKQDAIKYLDQWDDKFWEETEYRVKQITHTFERNVRAQLGVKAHLVDAGAEGCVKQSDEEIAEVRQRAQAVVNHVQIQELFDLIEVLKEDIFDDPQYHVYITMDRLDEHWIEDSFRYRLIRALIEAVRDFIKVKNAKIIVALRRDLIDRVIRETRDTGFQEEKYSSLYLSLRWSKDELLEILDRRINKLVRQQYTKARVTHRDLMPKRVGAEPIDDYLLARTMYRPRDLILFFNTCIERADGKAIISPTILKESDAEYSRERLGSLADEWQSVFPELIHFTSLLKGRTDTFRIDSLSDQELENFCLETALRSDVPEGPLSMRVLEVADGLTPLPELRNYVLRVFFRVGLIGLKTESFAGVMWSFKGSGALSPAELTGGTVASISPIFWRVLGVMPEDRK